MGTVDKEFTTRASGFQGLEMKMNKINFPNGFSANWTQSFNGINQVYCMAGADDESALSAMDSQARCNALEYWSEVAESLDRAIEQENEAAQALDEGDFQRALECARAAAAEEQRWGDCPTYKTLIDELAKNAASRRAAAADPVDMTVYSADGANQWFLAVMTGMPETAVLYGEGRSAEEAANSMTRSPFQSALWEGPEMLDDGVIWEETDSDIFEFDGVFYCGRDRLEDAIYEDVSFD